jgi:hypothetical protein
MESLWNKRKIDHVKSGEKYVESMFLGLKEICWI